MRYYALFVGALIATLPHTPIAFAGSSGTQTDAEVVLEATDGRMKSTKGNYIDACGESQEYDTEVVDLNGDGQPEVFTGLSGLCMGGMSGNYMELYIKKKSGQWEPQFGFAGVPVTLKTKNKGYPDIVIGGPGFCFPVWRWNGQKYLLDRFEYDGKACTPR